MKGSWDFQFNETNRTFYTTRKTLANENLKTYIVIVDGFVLLYQYFILISNDNDIKKSLF